MSKTIIAIFFALVIVLAMNFVIAATPFGANYTEISTSKYGGGVPQSRDAIAGNVTELDVTGLGTTQTWQGYFGNISGAIQLSDANSNVMYNWSLVSAEGEVFAANHSTVSWTTIACFNYTANGTYEAEPENYGNVSKNGLNMSQLETAYNIKWDDSDGVNETFALNNHPEFFVANYNFTVGECKNTQVFSDAKKGETGIFDEVLLYDTTRRVPIFASLLENNEAGFDSQYHDFEMLVLDDGHGTDTLPTTYYFYVELE